MEKKRIGGRCNFVKDQNQIYPSRRKYKFDTAFDKSSEDFV